MPAACTSAAGQAFVAVFVLNAALLTAAVKPVRQQRQARAPFLRFAQYSPVPKLQAQRRSELWSGNCYPLR